MYEFKINGNVNQMLLRSKQKKNIFYIIKYFFIELY